MVDELKKNNDSKNNIDEDVESEDSYSSFVDKNQNDLSKGLEDIEKQTKELQVKLSQTANDLIQKTQQFEALERRFRQLIADSTESEKNWKRRMDALKNDSMTLEEAVQILDFLRMGVLASASFHEVHEGMKMAYVSCLEIFRKKNVEVIEVNSGDEFDSNIHKVIGVLPDDEIEPGKVVSGRPGYFIGSGSEKRVLKHAEVVLSEEKIAQ